MVETPTKADPYRQYVRFIVRMFKLLKDDPELESDEAEAARQDIEGVWHTLSDQQKKRLQGLSLDLKYLLKPGRSGAGALTGNEPPEINRLKLASDPDRALELLRGFQDKMPAPMVSFIRGRIWMEWGYLEAAAEFFRDAWSFNRNDQLLQGMFLQASLYEPARSTENGTRHHCCPPELSGEPGGGGT